MRAPHHLHGILDMTPLFGFFGLALALASLGIPGRLGDRLEAVLLDHLPGDGVDLHLRCHVALLMHSAAELDSVVCGSLQTAEPQVSFHSPAYTILGLCRAAPERLISRAERWPARSMHADPAAEPRRWRLASPDQTDR